MNTVVSVLKYLPYVITLVSAVETTMVGAPGADKKALVLSGIQAAAAVGETIPVTFIAAISKFIDTVVKAFNDTGIFKKSPTVVTPVVPAA